MTKESKTLPSVDPSFISSPDDVASVIEKWAEAQAKAAPRLNEEQLEILRELFG
ncbi:hypothetical protein [Streptomyces lydicus]|uniref:hypothetical protein n=1 Tax=Streptomyces lydicus TaxID=47763 RepID=UPI0013E99C44|nr:hypothetical protein [Streptomyces lydicus]